MSWYLAVLKKYAVFSGRARRREYWMFILFNALFAFAASLLDAVLFDAAYGPFGPLYTIYFLAVLVPNLAVAVRRLHDVGWSGWSLFIGLIPLVGWIWIVVLHCTDSQPGENQYGPNPKA